MNRSDTDIDTYPSNTKIRNKEKYHVNQTKPERSKNSSIPFLQRRLNESAKMKENNC